MPNVEQNKLTTDERIVSPEEWEALSELFEDCLDRDVPITIGFETGRTQTHWFEDVTQGQQGFVLKINGSYSYDEDGKPKLFRSVRELVKDGWKLLAD